MNSLTLQQLRSFNQHLVTLAAAGLPIETGFSGNPQMLSAALEQVENRFALQVGRGQSIDHVIANDSGLPASYRAALETGLRSATSLGTLQGLFRAARAQQNIRFDMSYSLVYPLLLLILVYLGLIYLGLAIAPKIERIYQQTNQPYSTGLTWLVRIRETMPFWIPLVPIVLLAAGAWWRRNAPTLQFRFLPGSARYRSALHHGNYAEQLALLLDQGFPLVEALARAGPIPCQPHSVDRTARATTHLIEHAQRGQLAAMNDPELQPVPPLLRWSLTRDLQNESLADVLRVVGENYRRFGSSQARLWNQWTPTFCTAVLGGLLVLGFALSLFVPMIQLVHRLALPVGS